jgi:hypothetical protein
MKTRTTYTPTVAPKPQRLLALERANEVRRVRAELKRRIGAGQLSAAEVILECPVEARGWPVARLLVSQPSWGRAKCSKFLARTRISELKTVGELTGRQRELLAAELRQLG